MDFSKLLSKDSREKIKAQAKWQDAEINRFYRLSNEMMAKTILRYSREIQEEKSKELSDDRYKSTYSGSFVFGIMPLLAKKLSGNPDGIRLTELEEEMIQDLMPRVPEDPEKFRSYVYSFMANHGFSSYEALRGEDTPDSIIDLICKEILHGNPVSIATERVCPAQSEYDDEITKQFRSSSDRLFDHGEFLSWSPELVEKRAEQAKEQEQNASNSGMTM